MAEKKQDPPCGKCDGSCCKIYGYKSTRYIRLRGNEAARFPKINIEEHDGVKWLKTKKDMRTCIYFNEKTGKCTIYSKRPKVCMDFNCRNLRDNDPLFKCIPFLKKILSEEPEQEVEEVETKAEAEKVEKVEAEEEKKKSKKRLLKKPKTNDRPRNSKG